MSRVSAVAILTTLSMTACESPSTNSPYLLSDSAGIQLVAISPPAVPDTLEVSDEPTWSHTSILMDEPHPLSDVHLHPAEGDRVVVGEEDGFVWIGDPVDEVWVSVARPGDGPSEIGRLTSVRYHRGAIWVADGGRERLLEFASSGELVSRVQMEDPSVLSGDWAPSPTGHTFLGAGPGWTFSDEVIQRPLAPVVRVSGEEVDTLFEIPHFEWFITDWGTGSTLLRPFAHLVGEDGVMWVGDAAKAEIFRWSGSVTVVVRWAFERWDARAVADSLLDAAIATLPLEQVTPEVEAQVRRIPVSPEPLKFDGLIRSEGGGVLIGPPWASCCDLEERPAGVWLSLAADGTPDHMVVVPSRFEPSYFGNGYVLGVFRDELGQEAIQRRELIARR